MRDGREDAERVYRYYYSLADKAQKRHVGISAVVVLAALAAGVSLIVEFSPFVAAGLFFAVTALTLWSFFRKDAEHAAMANLMSVQYRQLASEWEALRHGDPCQGSVNALRMKHDTMANAADLPHDQKISENSSEEAKAVIN